jgi:D-cysteine desulfhydrase family pyridoxal phosphate-dependent enzyme
MKIEDLPRHKTGILPTPLEYCKNLSAKFKDCEIWIKRDDLTGHSFGGNKERKLEFILGDALKNESKTIVTVGSLQSNHCRITASLARKFNMDVELVLISNSAKETAQVEANYFLDKIMGAKIHLVKSKEVRDKIKELLADLESKGKKPYFIEGGGHNPLGVAGYALAVKELNKQMEKEKVNADYIFLPTGTGTTHAGLLAGKELYGFDPKIVGISIARPLERCLNETVMAIDGFFALLKKDFSIDMDIRIYDKYIGKSYGSLTDEAIKAVRLLAQTEGIVLDPVYNAKAFAGMLDRIKRKKISGNIIYLLTGGAPGSFVQSHIKKLIKGI